MLKGYIGTQGQGIGISAFLETFSKVRTIYLLRYRNNPSHWGWVFELGSYKPLHAFPSVD